MSLHQSESNEKTFIAGCGKVLFLDVDGVLNSEATFKENHLASQKAKRAADFDKIAHAREFFHPLGHINTTLVGRLNRIVRETGCKIVISSSWRILYGVETMRGFLTQRGFEFADSIIDRTGSNSKDARGGEIQDWLDAHPEVKNYVILDDDAQDIVGDYTTKTHPNNFVHTRWTTGLQDEHAEQAIKILNKNI